MPLFPADEREREGEDGEINLSSLIRLLGALIRPNQSLLPALLPRPLILV